MRKTLFTLLLLATGVVGCGDDSEKTPPPATIPAPPQAARAEAEKPRVEPVYALEITPSKDTPKKYIVSWSAKVPTGGWKLIKETVQVEEKHRELRMASVYATLEEPGPNEIVTEAEQTVTDQHDAGTEEVNGAELWVRRRVKGVESPWKPLYAQVKTAGKQY